MPGLPSLESIYLLLKQAIYLDEKDLEFPGVSLNLSQRAARCA